MELQQRKRLVYLAGFMGSGKSTIGPILANTIGFEYVDVDKLIEDQIGKRITEIFEELGEPGFRSLEKKALKEVAERNDTVIALGGGTIANEENFKLIHGSGVIVYLKLSPGEILKRVKHKTDRPLLKDVQGAVLSEGEMQKRIEDLLQSRHQFYARADVVVETDRQRVGRTIDEIVHKLRHVLAI